MSNVRKTIMMIWIYFIIASVVVYIVTKDILPIYMFALIIGLLVLNTLFLTRIVKKREATE